MRPLCAVWVPAICMTQNGSKVHFHVHSDVIEGQLPFLIGVPTLKAMFGFLDFKRIDLSIGISGTLRRTQLVNKNLNLYFPLRSTSAYSRPLGGSSAMASSTSHQLQPKLFLHCHVTKLKLSTRGCSSIESERQGEQKNSCSERGTNRFRGRRGSKTREEKKEVVCFSSASRMTNATAHSVADRKIKSDSASPLSNRPVCSAIPRIKSASVSNTAGVDYYAKLRALTSITACIANAAFSYDSQLCILSSTLHHSCHHH